MERVTGNQIRAVSLGSLSRQIATIDRRDFGLIRPRHVAAFRLLPEVLAFERI
ncbi:hypothetical protein [Microbispora bryophytorum]|uniref:Type II toxin-antitoxin system PemK/MazF family toxin n=1 Tax=Microbispora bryophytorum subsp. camponoti TaxID=1677852 RepID=A0ABR8KZ41_9ACTN|nr:hypothetical protein [Microbispora camponoti]MBD3142947.1 hypothetical protein [Microbispora camponoti]